MNRREREPRQALHDERRRRMDHVNGFSRDASGKLKRAMEIDAGSDDTRGETGARPGEGMHR